MKNPSENSKQTLERFLDHLGEPVPDNQAERSSLNVLDRLRAEDVREDVRVPARVVTMPTAARPVQTPVWSTIAAVAALMLTGALLHMALLNLRTPNTAANSVGGDVRFAADGRDAAYSHIESGRLLRAGVNGGVLTLPDGSHVDMSPSAELSVVRMEGDLRVRLASGTVLITAAKQKEGHHLYVETKDCVISVIGTVFQVNAERTGSRISVIEGEVHVQRGEVSQTLVAGQQASTSPELGPLFQQEPRIPAVPQETVPPAPPQTVPPTPKPFDDIVWVVPVPQAQNGTGIVRGVVKNGISGEGIPDVTVILCGQVQGTTVYTPFNYAGPNQVPREAAGGGAAPAPIIRNKTFFFALWDAARCQQGGIKTDSMGRFEFRNVAAGQYVLSAEREGYVGGTNRPDTQDGGRYFLHNFSYSVGVHSFPTATAYTATFFKGDRTTVTVNSNETVPDVALTLVRGSFSGHVRDAEGKPVANAVVRIVARAAGAANDGQTVAVSLTNALGEYKIYGLQAGEYRVAATVANGLPGSEIWFSRANNPNAVTVITVADGEEITNIDMVVPRR
jgi:hypothetical protein